MVFDVVDVDHSVVIYRGSTPHIRTYDLYELGWSNCRVDNSDVEFFESCVAEADTSTCDFNGDGTIDQADEDLFYGHYGHYCVCPDNSSVDIAQSDGCLDMCPKGDLSGNPPLRAVKFAVHKYLRNVKGFPFAWIPAESIWISIPEPASDPWQGENFQFVCHPDHIKIHADGPTDGNGHTTATVTVAGGHGGVPPSPLPVTVLVADGDPESPAVLGEPRISPRSPDIDASGVVSPSDMSIFGWDYTFNPSAFRSDFDCSGQVNDFDFDIINYHYRHRCASQSSALPLAEGDARPWSKEDAESMRANVSNAVIDRWLSKELHPELRAFLEHVRTLPEPQELQGEQDDQIAVLPGVTSMAQSFPNPFRASAVISYQVAPPGGQVTILIFDVAGRRVRTLVNRDVPPGFYNVPWDGKNDAWQKLPGGVYFYQMKAPGFKSNKRMILMR